jgi:hypothetical protein
MASDPNDPSRTTPLGTHRDVALRRPGWAGAPGAAGSSRPPTDPHDAAFEEMAAQEYERWDGMG